MTTQYGDGLTAQAARPDNGPKRRVVSIAVITSTVLATWVPLEAVFGSLVTTPCTIASMRVPSVLEALAWARVGAGVAAVVLAAGLVRTVRADGRRSHLVAALITLVASIAVTGTAVFTVRLIGVREGFVGLVCG